MPQASLREIVRYTDKLLRINQVQDYDRAANGLQVENNGRVTRIAAMVDATSATIKQAVKAGADLLLVHHGLFWGPSHPWTGKRRQLLCLLLENNLAVYSSHLPLDLHPRFGNNAQLCIALGFTQRAPFFFDHGQFIGFKVHARVPLNELARRLQHAAGVKPLVIPAGPQVCRRIGVVSGGAGAELNRAVEEGVDTFITGEGPHWTFGLAEDLEVNLLYGGHYATETFGVKALAAHLSNKFNVPWIFLDHPTGM